MPAPTNDPAETVCHLGLVTGEYANLANQFTQGLSEALHGPMWILFGAFAGLWVVIQGLRLVVFRTTIIDVAQEFVFVMIAATLLASQGSSLVNTIYSGSLSMMGGVASTALEVAPQDGGAFATVNGGVPLESGMVSLVCTAQSAVKKVLYMGSYISQTGSLTDPMPWFYALALVVPYLFVVVVYFSQVVISMFRVIMLASVSSFLMLGFGFGWGRDMMKSGVKTLLSAFMILFGATAALAMLIFGINSLDIGENPTLESVRAMATLDSPEFILAFLMGWMGTAFMTEATGMANSIAGSVLSNTGVGIITAGATATAGMLTKNPATTALMGGAATGAGNFAHNASSLIGQGASHLGSNAAQTASDLLFKAKHNGRTPDQIAERFKNVMGK